MMSDSPRGVDSILLAAGVGIEGVWAGQMHVDSGLNTYLLSASYSKQRGYKDWSVRPGPFCL